VEAAPTRKRKCFAGNNSPQGFKPTLRLIEIIRVQDDQRATGPNGLSRSETTRKAAITEFCIGRTVINECPSERLAVESLATGDVADVELNVVDLSVFTTNAYGGLLG